MSQVEHGEEDDETTEPITVPPTANPDRVRVPPEGVEQLPDEVIPRAPTTQPEEER